MPGSVSLQNIKKLKDLQIYYEDKCSEAILQGEYRLWYSHCKNLNLSKDAEVLEILDNCNKKYEKKYFPNIHYLLKVLATIPVTTCSAERSFSTMKRVKNPRRNKLGDAKLSHLVLISANSNRIRVDRNEVLNIFAMKSRKLAL